MTFAHIRRRLRRARGRRLAATTGRLDLCGACGESFVCPVTWAEQGPADWWLMLRCGSCGASREVVASNAAVAAYDNQLDEGMREINAAAESLAREALAAEADALGTALDMDLLGADDFR
jgi:transcription elongation factor Elf1